MPRPFEWLLAATRHWSEKRSLSPRPRGTPVGPTLGPGDMVATGAEARVVIGDSNTVVKRFFDTESAIDRVRREGELLALLNSSLHPTPAQVRFPKLVALRPESLEIEMQFAPGRTLLEAAMEGSLPHEVGRVVARGLTYYTLVIRNAFHDFAPVNAIWDPGGQEVWFFDVASPHYLAEPASESLYPVHSLAYYLGAVAYQVARPRSPRRWTVMKSQPAFVREIWAEFLETGIRVPRNYLVQQSLDRYRISAHAGSRVWRRFWYATFGIVLARIFIRTAVAGLSGSQETQSRNRNTPD